MHFKREKRTTQSESLIGQKLKTGLLYVWNKAQQHFVNYLSKKTAYVSSTRLRNYLLIFCIVCSVGNVFLLIYPFISYNSTSTVITSQKIRFPIHPYPSGKQQVTQDSMITHHKYQKILKLEAHLDSLKNSAVNKKEYDSITKMYPGLQDSIILLKQLYHNQ